MRDFAFRLAMTLLVMVGLLGFIAIITSLGGN